MNDTEKIIYEVDLKIVFENKKELFKFLKKLNKQKEKSELIALEIEVKDE